MKKRGLGRSLNAILSPVELRASVAPENTARENLTSSLSLHQLPIMQLVRGQYQPRREMDEEALNELAVSIKAQGILQPILVRKLSDGKFEIIAGERRWRAAQKAELAEVPVVIKEIPDDAAMAIGLIENIQRENLNAIDEAFGLQRLVQEFSLTHQEIAEAVGRSRTAVSNLLRLLNLPASVQKYLQCGDIEMGHARALLALSESQQLRAAEHIVEKGLSVRDTEHYVKQLQTLSEGRAQLGVSPKTIKPEIVQLQKQLSSILGSKVVIQQNAKGKGKLILHYASAPALEALIRAFSPASKT
ncbi:MAG: ParB/RepB/Spo0J family partition protein [Pseudomonadota bacterium]